MSLPRLNLNVGGVVSLDLLKGKFAQAANDFSLVLSEGFKSNTVGHQKPITSTNTNKLNKTTNISINDFKEEAQIDNRLTSIPFLRFTQYNLFQPTLTGYTGGPIQRELRVFGSQPNTAFGDIAPSKFNMDASSVFTPIGSLGKQSGHQEKLNSRGFPFGNNFNLNTSEFRELVGKSDGEANQKMGDYRNAKMFFSEGQDIAFPLRAGGSGLGFNMTPYFGDRIEGTVERGYNQPSIICNAETYYNDEYQGSGTASETIGLDFKFVNESGGLRCFVRQNNGPSYNTLVNRTNSSGNTHDYKFTKERSTYVGQYSSGPLKSSQIQIQATSGTYQPFYFLPDLPNGVDTLRLKSLTEVRTANSYAKSQNTAISRSPGVTMDVQTLHSPTSVSVPTPSSSNNQSGVTFIGIDTQQTGMGLGDAFGFTQKMTASTSGKKGINHRRVFQMQLQASKSNISRGQERTILNYFFALETRIDIYDVGAPAVVYSFVWDFSGIDLTGGGGLAGYIQSISYGFMSPTFGMAYSDSRLKDNVRLIHRPNGHNVYAWDWNKLAKSIGADKQPNYGLIADELVGTNPEALEKDENGYWKINYFKLRQNKKE